MGRIPVLWLCGPSGVGKSTVGHDLFDQLGREGVAVAFVDLDQLRLRAPADDGDPMNHRVRAFTLGGVWAGFRAAGARCVVLGGLVDDVADLRRHIDRLPDADVTVCRLRVGPGELRERMTRRGSNLELVDDSVRNAAELDGTSFADLVLDTSGRSVGEVVRQVRAAGWPGRLPSASPVLPDLPVSFVDGEPPLPLRGADDAETSVLLVCGPPAVGKSAVGYGAYLRAAGRGVPAAYIDLAQIGFCRPAPADDPGHHRLKTHNLARMWREYRADGVRFLVVTGDVTGPGDVDRYRAAVPSSGFHACLLRARPETLTARVLLRGSGGGPPLVGDDLRGRLEADLLRRAGESARIAEALDRSGTGDCVLDTDDRDVADLAVRVSAHVAGRAVRDDLRPRAGAPGQEAVYERPGQ